MCVTKIHRRRARCLIHEIDVVGDAVTWGRVTAGTGVQIRFENVTGTPVSFWDIRRIGGRKVKKSKAIWGYRTPKKKGQIVDTGCDLG